MTQDELYSMVSTLAPDTTRVENTQMAEVIVSAEHIVEVCKALKDGDNTKMDYLFCQTAADRKDGFHVVYFLTSSTLQHKLKLKVVLEDKSSASVHSVCTIWRSAEFYEREIFDLFGIHFDQHPDLRRIFLEDDWVGHPLRKDYKDEFTIVQ